VRPDAGLERRWGSVALLSAAIWIGVVAGLAVIRKATGQSTDPAWYELTIGPIALVVLGRAQGVAGRYWIAAAVGTALLMVVFFIVFAIIYNLMVYGGINS
jgi:hypothetical protein